MDKKTVRHIEAYVSEDEYQKLVAKKGDRNWREFLVSLVDDVDAEDKEILNTIKAICEKIKS